MIWLRSLLALVLLCLASVPATAQIRELPQSREQVQLSFAPVVRQTAPAVVNIYTRRLVRNQLLPFFQDPFFQRFFGNNGFGIPRERVERSLGSGVIVSEDGLIVTNNHVAGQGSEILVVLSDKREFEAKVLLADERTDLAVLKIETNGSKLPTIAFDDSDSLQVGDLVLAIGNPFGVGQTVTSGIVSALARTAAGISDYQFFIQTDAAINPGNSGGALVDMNGRLVGINTAIYSRSGGSIGIGFAIPANTVRMVVESARAGGKVVRPWLGVNMQDMTADIAESLGLAAPTGAVVLDGHPLSPLIKAGLRTGDVLIAIDGKPVDSPAAANYRFSTLRIGGRAEVAFLRDGKRMTAQVAVIAPPEEPAQNRTTLQGRSPLAGLVVANLSPAVAEELGVPSAREGVVVVDLARGPARQLGFRPGDILVEVNGRKLGSVKDAVAATQRSARMWEVVVNRKGQVISSTFGG
ncbi:DegQ family serine endoprotease [Rhodoligotrophos defluvii]|uniref:DegQ family serine endoprotease n=1 Tax=Rhodoligotrophos defluvii TaxID=2561934 RepID=UPI0010C996B9|nr:DegQ family serine endoprotease [Rhodoligotrophos defluvii]